MPLQAIALEGLQKAGRAYEIVFVGGNLNAIQTGVEADLGISVLSRLSLSQRMVVLESEAGLPDLQSADLAIYSRKNTGPSDGSALTTFLVESVAAWERDSQPSVRHNGKPAVPRRGF